MSALHPDQTIPAPIADERLVLVQRVAGSRTFHRSARQREFLLYIGHCAVENRLEDTTEFAIGRRVFGRGADYDPVEDNIVRVAARHLRIRLREYFETEGASENLIIEIPKGAYAPVFVPRASAPSTAAATLATMREEPAAVPAAMVVSGRSASVRFFGICSLLLMLAALWLWRENRELRAELAGRQPQLNALMSALRGTPSNRITVVMADSSFGAMVNYIGTTPGLEEYAARRYPTLPDRPGHWSGAQDFFSRLLNQKLTSIADVELASKIMHSAAEQRSDVRLRHARDVNTRDFQSDNLVVIGGPRTNPWTQLLDNNLNFRFAIDDASNRRELVNNHPAPGESTVYADGIPRPGASYARVAIMPNLGKTGKIILIGGTRIAGTEAAGDFMLSQTALAVLRRTLQISDLSTLSSLEIVLEIEEISGTPRQARLVCWRASRT